MTAPRWLTILVDYAAARDAWSARYDALCMGALPMDERLAAIRADAAMMAATSAEMDASDALHRGPIEGPLPVGIERLRDLYAAGAAAYGSSTSRHVTDALWAAADVALADLVASLPALLAAWEREQGVGADTEQAAQ